MEKCYLNGHSLKISFQKGLAVALHGMKIKFGRTLIFFLKNSIYEMSVWVFLESEDRETKNCVSSIL